MRIRRAGIALAMTGLALAHGASARAQPTTPNAAAEQTFNEGVALYEEGKVAPACRKFEESFALDPANGTLQNLAACHEAEGRRARALAEWSELLVRATRSGQHERETLSKQRITALGAVLPRLKLRHATSSNVGSITIDGVSLDASAWKAPVTVDPGAHEIVFAGEGLRSATIRLEISDPALVEVDVPRLEKVASAEPRPEPVHEPTSPAIPRPEARSTTLGWTVAGIGVALVGTGGVFGVLALDKRSDSDAECPGGRCTQRGVDLNDQAMRNAWVANVGIGVGLVAIAMGVYLALNQKP